MPTQDSCLNQHRARYRDDMSKYVAFLRAVNVGGTGRLAMADLRLELYDGCRILGRAHAVSAGLGLSSMTFGLRAICQ